MKLARSLIWLLVVVYLVFSIDDKDWGNDVN